MGATPVTISVTTITTTTITTIWNHIGPSAFCIGSLIAWCCSRCRGATCTGTRRAPRAPALPPTGTLRTAMNAWAGDLDARLLHVGRGVWVPTAPIGTSLHGRDVIRLREGRALRRALRLLTGGSYAELWRRLSAAIVVCKRRHLRSLVRDSERWGVIVSGGRRVAEEACNTFWSRRTPR